VKKSRRGLKTVERESPDDGRKRQTRRKPRAPRSGDTLDEVNRILDKIGDKGMESLTPAELKFLNEMSERRTDPDQTH
jgi:hypothetical protein